uniref:EF-hand domain-containing protein n=1 Tax=Romanomermis culicivorax TaxID=13658 RepID=A0A915L1I7_ROMCU
MPDECLLSRAGSPRETAELTKDFNEALEHDEVQIINVSHVIDKDYMENAVYTHQLHPHYISAAVKAFQEFDTNRKDQLNLFQFTNAMADFTIKFPQFGHPTDWKMSEMFNYLDEGKGYVNFDDWITGITLMTNRENFVIQEMEKTFDALDTGKQGYISIDQFAKFLRDFGYYDEQDIQLEIGLVRNRCSDPANAQITKYGNFMSIKVLQFKL